MFFQPDLLHTRDQTISSVLAGAKGLTWRGAATFSLTGANTLSGPLNIKGGNLTVGAGGAAGRLGNGVFNGTTTVAAGSVFNWNSTLAQTFLGAINGPGSMVVSVFANIGMATSNAISGGITMLSGNLSANGSSTQNTIWGTGPLVIGAAAFWSLQGWNSLGGATGPSSISLAGSCGTATGTANIPATTPVTITASTATFNCSAAGALNIAGTVNLQSFTPNLVAVSAGMAVNISGAISGTGGLNKNTGAGTVTLSGANTYTGPTTNLSSGNYLAGVASVPGVSGAFGLNSAITTGNFAGNGFNINGFNTQVGSLAGGGATDGRITIGAATLTFGGDNTSTTFAGPIAGTTGNLVKIGTGTQTFTHTGNTYTGTTTITGGSLAVGGAGRLNSGAYAGAIAISSSCSLAIGTSAAQTLSGVISGAGFLNKSSTGTLTLTGTNTYTGSTNIASGILSATAARIANASQINITVANAAPAASNSGQWQAGAGPNVGGKTLNIVITESGTGLTWDAMTFTGVSVAPSSVLVNGVPLTLTLGSGTTPGGTTVTYDTLNLRMRVTR